eukprot:CAMPEP_0185754410 /NCGR_PEP_ID=MMETSP1174-20130828/13062_1 /TAXON_ID=35687 /ORGANISM="Dictyocha speculum, Strain CCMP1381" /LENGTH=501 /DNA_ID=CAMNT_0028432603 /DNA_START=32 /DNA_END=1537 /DNA_ORIENTATION=-
MKGLWRAAIIVLTLPVKTWAEESAVITLTDGNFDENIIEWPLSVVEFYAPWCGHCKKLTPEYETAAVILQEDDPPIILSKVDATENPVVTSRFNVTGYPTLIIVKPQNGVAQWSDYLGSSRSAADIVKYVRSQVGPACKELKSSQEVTAFVGSAGKVSVLASFSSADDLRLAFFKAVSEELRDQVPFGCVQVDDVSGGAVGVTMYRSFPNEPKELFFEKIDELEGEQAFMDGLKEWVEKNRLPLVSTMSQEDSTYASDVLSIGEALAVLFIDDRASKKATKSAAKQLRQIAIAAGIPNMRFGYGKRSSRVMSIVAEGVGLGENNFAIIQGYSPESWIKYVMPVSFDVDAAVAYLRAFEAGELKPFLRSEAELPQDEDEMVRTVVATSFDKIVLDETKDVLIEFYAPWCQHCQQFAPVYEQLASAFENTNTLVVAKLNEANNDLPDQWKVEHYPTIRFVPAGNGPITTYEGSLDGLELAEFVRKHAVNSIPETIWEDVFDSF